VFDVLSVQRLFERVSQELLATRHRVAVRAVRTSSAAPPARLRQSHWTSCLLIPGWYEHVDFSVVVHPRRMWCALNCFYNG